MLAQSQNLTRHYLVCAKRYPSSFVTAMPPCKDPMGGTVEQEFYRIFDRSSVGQVGFEPTQHRTTDLQSAPALQLRRCPKCSCFTMSRFEEFMPVPTTPDLTVPVPLRRLGFYGLVVILDRALQVCYPIPSHAIGKSLTHSRLIDMDSD